MCYVVTNSEIWHRSHIPLLLNFSGAYVYHFKHILLKAGIVSDRRLATIVLRSFAVW